MSRKSSGEYLASQPREHVGHAWSRLGLVPRRSGSSSSDILVRISGIEIAEHCDRIREPGDRCGALHRMSAPLAARLRSGLLAPSSLRLVAFAPTVLRLAQPKELLGIAKADFDEPAPCHSLERSFDRRTPIRREVGAILESAPWISCESLSRRRLLRAFQARASSPLEALNRSDRSI